jgi:GT2 family glycosyltransferase
LVETQLISVIIPTFRRFNPLLNTLDDLLQQVDVAFEVVIADQNPEWPTACRVRLNKFVDDTRVHLMTLEQPGVVRARNLAVKESSGAILLFLDDDVRIPNRRFLARHVANYEDESLSAVVGRELRPDQARSSAIPADSTLPGDPASEKPPHWSDRPPVFQVLSFDRNSDRRTFVHTFCTCNSSIRRSEFLRVGGFDEHFSGNSYGDDYDLAIRLAAKGGKTVYDPLAALIHLQLQAGGLRLRDARNTFTEKDKALSACLFFLRHARRGCRWYLLYNHLLRKTVLLKKNVVECWRQPRVWGGLISAWKEARLRNREGPVSIFAKATRESLR